jgi:transcription-repair coupling factor (superfamily II helicase)
VSAVERMLEVVGGDPALRRAFGDLEARGECVLAGLACSAKALALARLHRDTLRPLLVVVPGVEEADALLGDLEVCLGDERVFLFAETEVLPYDRRSPHADTLGERIPCLGALGSGQSIVCVTTARALAGRIPSPSDFARMRLPLKVGEPLERDALAEALLRRGFRAERLVEEVGTFAVRGGIVDFFPFGSRHPVRVELLGDRVESLRTFDAVSQRTVDRIERIDVLPQRELLPGPDETRAARAAGDLPFEEGANPFVDGIEAWLPRFHPDAGSLLRHFRPGGIVVLDEPDRLREALAGRRREAQAAFDAIPRGAKTPPPPGDLFLGPDDVAAELAGRVVLRLSLFAGDSTRDALRATPSTGVAEHRVQVRSQETFRGGFALLRERLHGLVEEGNEVWVFCDNRGQLARLEEMLEGLAGPVRLAVASLRNGFSMPERGLVVLTDHEMFARTARRRRAFRHGGGAPIHDYASLKRGDFVVHTGHGVGRYDGIELLATGGFESECLCLRYQEGASIYVPVDQINLVQKYIGGDAGTPPVVARLGTAQWERTKARARRAVEKMAAQLLEIHAARQAKEGHAFSRDGEWQREMEASFVYEETPDQRKATDAVKRDMEDRRPMDRLVCGDVGYGKTEVAIRAAFKAVGDGKQVCVLVPTTILAQQHLETFRERLRAYPVRVDMLSRFRSPKEQKETLARLASGDVDVVIGTHRVLSKDVRFRDLGLVVVDEEQRFGVKHKERLKELRKLVDVLTLTATPIPRTLNMALLGLRDISVIETPPPNKLPIVTEVVEASDDVVRKAIVRETQRGGQTFFVHNRVQSIDGVAGRLRELLPELRFDVAHGQMPEAQLERVMLDFLARRSDVLVSTMIIESGLDLPNVNTILINRADAFGLAQLYQLRGRVGRSNHRAFAYLLVPAGAQLTDVARKRLRAIEEFSELGAGFRLAMRDMEIRGAGNFLGPEQSGHMEAVGYDLYVQMLREAMADLRGEARPEERLPVRLDFAIDAYLPEDYIADPDQRIVFYKRLADLAETAGVERLGEELRDRYGRLPEAAEHLLKIKELRLLAETAGVAELRARDTRAALRFHDGRAPRAPVVHEMVRLVPAELSFFADGREALRIGVEADGADALLASVEALLRVACGSDTLSVSQVGN